MTRFKLIILPALALVCCGCELSGWKNVFVTPSPIVIEEMAQPDPEMQELLAVMGRLSPAPQLELQAAGVSNLTQHSYQAIGGDNDPCIDRDSAVMVYSSTAYTQWPDIFIKRVDGMAVTQLTTDPASDIQPALSPDGRYVAFSSRRSGNYEIYIMTSDGRTIQQLTFGGGENVHPSWSRDGSKIIYSCHSDRSGRWEMWIIPLGAPANRQFVGYGLFPVWSPTEDRIVYQRPRERDSRLFGIWTIRMDNGEPSLPTMIAASAEKAYVSPAFNAAGDKLVFIVMDSSGAGRTDLFVINLDGSDMQQITRGPGRKFSPAWADNRIYFTCDRDGHENIWSIELDDKLEPAASMVIFGSQAK